MKTPRDIPKLVLWLQKYSPRLRELIKNARFHESVADGLCRMAEDPLLRCPSQLRFATDCPKIFVWCKTSDIVRAMAGERSTFRSPRFFDLHKEILWQWFCEHDEGNSGPLSYNFETTEILRYGSIKEDCLTQTLQSGVATIECLECKRRGLKAEYSEMASDVGSTTAMWVTKKSTFRCPNCHSQFFVRDDRRHYQLSSAS